MSEYPCPHCKGTWRVSDPEPVPPEVRAALLAGYEGDPCPRCGHRCLVGSGTAWICDACGANNCAWRPGPAAKE